MATQGKYAQIWELKMMNYQQVNRTDYLFNHQKAQLAFKAADARIDIICL